MNPRNKHEGGGVCADIPREVPGILSRTKSLSGSVSAVASGMFGRTQVIHRRCVGTLVSEKPLGRFTSQSKWPDNGGLAVLKDASYQLGTLLESFFASGVGVS